jgi:hypothetical protein
MCQARVQYPQDRVSLRTDPRFGRSFRLPSLPLEGRNQKSPHPRGRNARESIVPGEMPGCHPCRGEWACRSALSSFIEAVCVALRRQDSPAVCGHDSGRLGTWLNGRREAWNPRHYSAAGVKPM